MISSLLIPFACCSELLMKWRRQVLGLPKTHHWKRADWIEFEKLDKRQLARDLKVPLAMMETLFPMCEAERFEQRFRYIEAYKIAFFVDQNRFRWDGVLLANIFKSVYKRAFDE